MHKIEGNYILEEDEYKDMLRQINEYNEEIRRLEKVNVKLREELGEFKEVVHEEYRLKERRVNYYRLLVIEMALYIPDNEFARIKQRVIHEVMK